MTDPRDQYRATTLRILGNFQLIEFTLKVYIAFAYRIIAHSTKDLIPFNYSFSDVESFPLERLLNIFSKMNENAALIDRLNKLRKERNHIAHESLLVAAGSDYDANAVKESEEAFFYLEDEVAECLKALVEETHTIRGKLPGPMA